MIRLTMIRLATIRRVPNRSTPPRRLVLSLCACLLALAGCGGGSSAPAPVDAGNWAAVLAAARGQTVNFYAYGGDEAQNRFLTGYVADALRRDGITLNLVQVADTADAVNKVLGERQAGRTSGGAVDLVWLNGENFATGQQAKLWYCGWDRSLPNARFVDFASPFVATDFGVPVDGCEATWQRADSALVYDSAALSPADVASVSSLLGWASANPGRFTYAAPPDFTGSMAVRTVLYDTLGGPAPLAGPFDEAKYGPAAERLWERLRAVEPSLWRGGSTYPQSQDEVERLYAAGEISAFYTYGPGATAEQVRTGQFRPTTRTAVPAPGNLGNQSFVAIPANAEHRPAALVLANLLQDPASQLELYRTAGIFPGIDLGRTDPATRARFDAVRLGPAVLPLDELIRRSQPELASAYLTRLEDDWTTNVLQR